MKVRFGTQEVEIGGEYLDADLRDCNDLLDDRDALQQRMKDDGYLLIRGLHDRERVMQARRTIFQPIADAGAIKPGTDPIDGVIGDTSRMPRTLGNKQYTHHPDVLTVLENPRLFEFFETFLGREAMTYNYKWLRAVGAEAFTGAHYDVVYMGRGTQDYLYTCWTPMGDIPLEMGGLALCVGSHNLPGFQKVRDTYGKMDVDRDNVTGWFEGDPTAIVNKFGGKWKTTEYQAGDVLIFGMFTMHGSLVNTTDRFRLSCDTRFQPADEPVDDRWIGDDPKAHYAWNKGPATPMEKARAEWGV